MSAIVVADTTLAQEAQPITPLPTSMSRTASPVTLPDADVEESSDVVPSASASEWNDPKMIDSLDSLR